MNGVYDLQRFVDAQEGSYAAALSEIRSGHKESHWMWYIFPQLAELGESCFSKHFGILDIDHARAYLAHPVLGPRLREISGALLLLDESDPLKVMDYPDHMKLCSCMTLFDQIEPNAVFRAVLDKFYEGREDPVTLRLLR